MRPGMSPEWQAALEAAGIVTAWAIRFDFAAQTVGVWTGDYTITPNGTGDSLLDGVQFDTLKNGIVGNVGDNSFTMSGSDQLDIALTIPASYSAEIAAVNTLPAEWQARPATVWRALLMRPADPLGQPVMQFRRVRTGSIDVVEWNTDGSLITCKLTIESHASLISDATAMTYMNQSSIDPTDTSQNFVVSIASGNSFNTNYSGVMPTNGLVNTNLGNLLK